MPRIQAIDPKNAGGDAKKLFDAAQAKMGRVPNILRAMGNSAAALEGYLNFSGALAKGQLDPKIRELIAVTVAEANACEYCLSAHTAIGKMAGLGDDALESGRNASSDDPKTDAALKFAHLMVVKRGELGDSDAQTLRDAGWGEGEIVEIVANVALNIFTNYFNHIAGTEIDFPRVSVRAS